MELKEIKNKDHWEKKIGLHKQGQFLQSWDWGQFQRNNARKIWHLDIGGDYFLVIKMKLPYKKSYLYIPRTNFKLNDEQVKVLRKLAKSEKSIFIRIESVTQSLLELGFKHVKPMQPAKTLILDLNQSEEDLLMEMHQKTRYNIRLAAKKGVSVREGSKDDFEVFYNLMLDTYKRKDKRLFNKEYYQKMLKSVDGLKIFLAEYEGKVLCANLIMFYGDTVTYLHGGSSQEHKNLMAPHLLQWEVIKQAKENSYKYYDFWGIEERYPGVARFKTGFGGQELNYPGTFDLVLKPLWYLGYNIVKRFK